MTESLLKGDLLALARTLSHVENDTPQGQAALQEVFPRTGRAHVIGVTGAPGTGKSSLVNRLALQLRSDSIRVAIVAIDPSSPFTGGAVLGDRIRMKDLTGDPNIFIRSMASRGALGGLAAATSGLVQIFDAAGYDYAVIETVGAGQGEVEVARLAHTTLVVEAPGLGDDIQAIKAGILEIADILVVNKADRPGAESTEKALRAMLELGRALPAPAGHHGPQTVAPSTPSGNPEWLTPIMRTIATDGTGIQELAVKIREHGVYLHATGRWERREEARLAVELHDKLQKALLDDLKSTLPEGRYNEVMQEVARKQRSPGEAVSSLIKQSRGASSNHSKLPGDP